jgi:hypothetical protein
MEDLILSLLIVVALLHIVKFVSPICIPLLIKLFPGYIQKTQEALQSNQAQIIQRFEDFSDFAKSAFLPWRKELEKMGFTLLVDYKSPAFEKLGGQSFSSVWTDQSKTLLVCLSSVSHNWFFQLLSLLKGFSGRGFDGRENAVLLETSFPGLGRLFTYSGTSPLPEMPLRYRVKSLVDAPTLSRMLEVHHKRLKKWQQEIQAVPLVYDSRETFFEEQKSIRQELRRFTEIPEIKENLE